jgi:hypothetical protein
MYIKKYKKILKNIKYKNYKLFKLIKKFPKYLYHANLTITGFFFFAFLKKINKIFYE